MLELPFPGFSDFTQELTLEGRILKFGFQWNTRGQFWNMDIYTKSNEPIVTGVKIVIDYELIQMFADPRLPKGGLYAYDVTRRLQRIEREDLGKDIKLYYLSAQEMENYELV